MEKHNPADWLFETLKYELMDPELRALEYMYANIKKRKSTYLFLQKA